ncbi:response regulator [Rufibacter sediminis]|uniref:Response regulator n=1 Tax=Rufibacter sediminis TaxID=2762756 RepID=A0ABR6VN70_9BACT|nr:response regulator [Rufibacter sediminis]MBC3538636.1 response regulator [Rufibacter sediminis]
MEERRKTEANPEKLQQINTVMVVDDDDNWIFVSKLILKRTGVGQEVITARNGREAFSILQAIAADPEKQMPELLFLDIRMPVMDGFEFLEEVTNVEGLDFSQTRIYMCSSSLNPVDKQRADLFPVAGFITKPLTKEALLQILSQ